MEIEFTGEFDRLFTCLITDITLASVSEYVCSELMAGLSRSAERLSINGTVVKAVAGQYQAEAAKTACTDGDSNDLVITFK